MSFTKEIITLQIGHYSNFVGTHWWNIQESSFCYDPAQADFQPINHDVLFREGLNFKGETTFTPRLIALDLKGSLKSLRQEGTLYSSSNSSNDVKWLGGVEIQQAPEEGKNEYLLEMEKQEEAFYSNTEATTTQQADTPLEGRGIESFFPKKYDLDESVEVWSDFLRAPLHPKSILLLEEYHHDNKSDVFDFFGCGAQLASKETFKESMEDRIRCFVEETDYLQGFQVLLDGYNGFSGVASSILLHLEEEYGPKACICYPLFQPVYKNFTPGEIRTEDVYRFLSSLLCLDKLLSASSLFSPLSLGTEGLFQAQQKPVQFNHVSYKAEVPYHTSAILAVALESLTLPNRLKTDATHLRDQAQQMAYGCRKLVSSSLCLPLPIQQRESISDFFSRIDAESLGLQPLTPLSHSANALIQSMVFTGIPDKAFENSKNSGKQYEEVIAKHISSLYPGSALFLKNLSPPCKVVAPFPNIFNSNIGGNGLTQLTARHEALGVQSVPVLAAYKNSSACSQVIDHLLDSSKKINVRKYHRCFETDIEVDDIKEALHDLDGFADNYRDSGFLTEG